MVVFLGLNGYRHDFTTDAAFDLVVGVAAGTTPWANRPRSSPSTSPPERSEDAAE